MQLLLVLFILSIAVMKISFDTRGRVMVDSRYDDNLFNLRSKFDRVLVLLCNENRMNAS